MAAGGYAGSGSFLFFLGFLRGNDRVERALDGAIMPVARACSAPWCQFVVPQQRLVMRMSVPRSSGWVMTVAQRVLTPFRSNASAA
jgi:hypothetical protein